MRFRGKPIRRKIVALLLVPLVSLVSVWAFATYLTGREAVRLRTATEVTEALNDPLEKATRAIQEERRQTLVHLADPRRSDTQSQLHRQQRSTDRAVDAVREAVSVDVRRELSAESRERLDAALGEWDQLPQLRAKAENNTLTRGGAFQAYNALVDPGMTFLSSLPNVHDAELERQGEALVGLTRAREYLSREDALIAAALVAGETTKGDRRALSDRIAERKLALETSLRQLPAEDQQSFQQLWNATEGRTLSSYEDALLTAGSREAAEVVDAERWREATSEVLSELREAQDAAAQRHTDRVDPVATAVFVRAGAVGVLGLLAVLVSIFVTVRIGRRLITDLSALRREANESAGTRLPSVMRRLAAGEQIDVETEAPRLDYPPDEAGQVGRALNTLQRSAVEAAVKQADLRRGVSEVFVNLARRNQVLLHRQLSLLDTMERRTEDEDELADLFRLDHLTTRMRRHAEGLVILSGAAPSRQWRKPVQLMDVARAAVAEVEDYERVEIRRLAPLAVDGGAVSDLTHLVAELIENATVFSPPHTAVQVRGERVANGFTLEIHDRGLGMTTDAQLDANLRLAETPEFELSDTDRLGLFVVSRLALRQGVRVSLQPSPYGGTTAVVLIPGAILTETPPEEDRVTRVNSEREPRYNRLSALSRGRAALDGGPRTGALDGPVELEAALADSDAPTRTPRGEQADDRDRTNGADSTARGLFRGTSRLGPSPEQHQQAASDSSSDVRGADEEAEHAPLPRRRPGTPVLVADHGRTVQDRREPAHRRTDTERRAGGGDPRPGSGDDTGATTGGGDTSPNPWSSEDERADPEDRGGAASGTVSGLPRRVRQASLVPQLRTDPEESDRRRPQRPPGQEDLDERDAERVRSRLASMQRGWQRGRRENDQPPGRPPEETRTTPEGEGQ
ncbi:nitrate- and nitrite sensing domain-containing protein [Streptomyces oceani]|uniref:histidine kinase n=1 Tax=Streptomyces oceani TaxID=1075402 RepID=A0A1E7JXV8_9ACTN|nr:nitrate- and nitrite sensing domain-containing protein [Streptomyces oceani]OEU96451.1 histidine kinase [Streptomyces oceani]